MVISRKVNLREGKLFEKSINEFAEDVELLAPQAVRVISLALFIRIILKTPVDTGFAKAGWQIGVSTENYLNFDPSTAKELSAEEARQLLRGVKDLDDFVVIGNNVVYIGALEDGHSKQSPGGMMSLSLEEVATLYDLK